MNFSPGTRVGPYEILSLLGAGGMGEVYRARDTRLLRDVAVKVLPAALVADEDRLRRFEVEARAASLLSHPNIVALYDVGRHDGSPFVVSELLQGETLRQRLEAGALSAHRALDYAVQVAQGLAAAHEKGIVHRDLKPENLFVTEDGHVKILDFGLAKLAGDEALGSGEDSATVTRQTDPGKVLGTVGYMSPEQVRGKPADHRSDIFSFGAILYETLSGRRAFKGDSAVETLNAILKDEPADLLETQRHLPPGLERVVRHCLEKRPEDRFQSARDLAFDLQSVSAASGSGPAPALAGPGARRGVRAALRALLLLLPAAAAFWAGRESAERPAPTYRRVTFRRGTIAAARFAGDPGSLVYTAAWYGGAPEVYAGRLESPDARSLGLHARVEAVSSSGEMALLLPPRTARRGPILARVSVEGGAPREILEDVTAADWARDGSAFAVVHGVGGRSRLEFPIGSPLYDGVWVTHPRISPDGSRVAFLDHPLLNDDRGAVAVADRKGRRTVLSDGWASAEGLAWSPDGREVWFTATRSGAELSLYGVSLSGKLRLLAAAPGRLVLQDVATDGRVLLLRNTIRMRMSVLAPGESAERDLSWHDHSYAVDLSSDGRSLLFSESGEAGGTRYGVYLRPTDGGPAVRLGEGRALALAPDGRWALTIPLDAPPRLVLLPTGPGQPREIRSPTLTRYQWATFFPDGQRILVLGSDAGGDLRLFVEGLAGGAARPITPAGVGTLTNTISPDGRSVIAFDFARTHEPALYPVEGGAPVPLRGLEAGEEPLRFTADGRSVFLVQGQKEEASIRISRLELATGRKELVGVTRPADAVGVAEVRGGAMTADGKAYVYNDRRTMSDLYIVENVR
jgi:Tol biopolymer transport system component